MSRFSVAITLILFLTSSSQAATVLQKSYRYRYEAAKDLGSDHEYVICDDTRRLPLVPELKALPLALRFNGQATAIPLSSPLETVPAASASTISSPEYRLEKTIHFGFDSAQVEDKHGLSLLATSLNTDPSVTGIRIKGFTCDIGSKTYNDRLAMRRALAAGSLLGRSGLRINEVSGEGKCCYVPGPRSLSRRVEISVIRSLGEEKHDEK